MDFKLQIASLVLAALGCYCRGEVDSNADDNFGANHFGSCVCQQSCKEEHALNSSYLNTNSLEAQLNTVLGVVSAQSLIMNQMSSTLQAMLEDMKTMRTTIAAQQAQIGEIHDLRGAVVPGGYHKKYKVMHKVSPQGWYKLNYNEADSLCRFDGGELATKVQLQAAWDQGMDMCSWGWTKEGRLMFPIQWPRNGCGGSTVSAGLVLGSTDKTIRKNVYCFYKSYGE